MAKPRNLCRRSVLRGAGATLTLPFLEIMGGRGHAAKLEAKPPIRTAFFYIPNGVVQRSWHPKD